ncbi:MAG TPA: hypothetical protein VN923_05015 [Thermoanaerobaculia bacterium]|nr:hypothetical protein [Thermoanaerobaculia bacterium]
MPADAATARAGGPGPRPLRDADGKDFADELFDELLPESLDWRHLVTRYPRAAVVVAAAAGFWIGRTKGGLVMAALTSYVAAQFGDAVVGLTEDEHVGADARH